MGVIIVTNFLAYCKEGTREQIILLAPLYVLLHTQEIFSHTHTHAQTMLIH